MKLHPNSPCVALVTPDDKGGLVCTVQVPTYSGGVELSLTVERSNDGDWVIFLPMWPDESKYPEMHEAPVTARDWRGFTYDVGGGIAYVGAPDVPVKAAWGKKA